MSVLTMMMFVFLLQPRGLDRVPGFENGPYSGPLPSKYERTAVREAVIYDMGPRIGKAVVVLAGGEPVEIYRIVGYVDKKPHFARVTNVVFRPGEEPDPESTGVSAADLDGDGLADLVFRLGKTERRYVFTGAGYRPE